ncbi:hypothetical protein IW262DRAFT_1493975 [Armillaria fumosa]|nr:hypothetical protein IW262DRAFT_1493975 [Armillaria fumosa]
MPLDIILCIFELLDPLDLLHLARLSKAFRRVLMSKSSISAWKSARSNIGGLPEPLYGLSEPAWANLIFVPVCHFCYKASAKKPELLFRARICTACMPLHMLSVADLERVPGSIRTDEGILPIATLIPISSLKHAGKRHPEESSLRAYTIKITFYSGFAVDRSLPRRRRAPMQIDKDMETEKLKRNRLQAIQQNLVDLGHGAELASTPSVDILAKHSLVNQTRPLTDRIWTNIQGELVKHMRKVKVDRLAREHHELLHRRRKLPSHVQDSGSEHTLPSLTPGHFHRITELILLHVDAWGSSVTQQVIDFTIGKDSPLSPEEKSSEVKLARNVFICENCTNCSRSLSLRCRNKPVYMEPLFFPDIIGHCCLSLGFDSRAKDGEIRRTAATSVRVPWNTTRLEINDRAHPETTTAEDLDDEMEDYQFKCYSCPNNTYVHNGAPPVPTFELYGWRDFVKHILVEHYEDTTPLENYVKLIPSGRTTGSSWKR